MKLPLLLLVAKETEELKRKIIEVMHKKGPKQILLDSVYKCTVWKQISSIRVFLVTL